MIGVIDMPINNGYCSSSCFLLFKHRLSKPGSLLANSCESWTALSRITEIEPSSEILCLNKTKTIKNVINNIHIYCDAPLLGTVTRRWKGVLLSLKHRAIFNKTLNGHTLCQSRAAILDSVSPKGFTFCSRHHAEYHSCGEARRVKCILRHWQLLRFWHSADRASWYILTIKANEMHYFSNLFDKVLYMFRGLE